MMDQGVCRRKAEGRAPRSGAPLEGARHCAKQGRAAAVLWKHLFEFSHLQTDVRTPVLYWTQRKSQCKRCPRNAEARSAEQSIATTVFHVCPYHACKILSTMEQPKGVSRYALAS